MSSDISIICKKTVISMTEVEPGKFCNLSVLDRIMEPCNLRMILYYRFPSDTDLKMLRKKLCLSLNELLSKFPVVTGRLMMDPKSQGHWMIKCNDAGVRTMEARVEGTLEDWFESLDREKELKLILWEGMFHKPYFWSTFYVQLTEFEGGGLAIGLSCSHMLADATSATMFIKAWADTHLFGKMQSPPLFHPLPPRKIGNKVADHELYTDVINHYKSSMERTNLIKTWNSKEYSTVTFIFTDEMVRQCMNEASSKSAPFTALAALFWLCISKVKGKKKEGLVNMNICLDMRNVLGLRKEFFGNCMVFNKVSGEEPKEIGLVNAAKAIENVASKMDNEGIMDLIEWLDENYSRDPSLTRLNGPDLICANWENLDPYSAELESGVEPVRVSYYLEPLFGEGQVLILPSPNGDQEGSMSRVAMVTLPKDQAVRLCEEVQILNFSPTILMENKDQ